MTLAEARTNLATARAALHAGELQLATAKRDESAVVPSAFDPSDVAKYRAARARAQKAVAERTDDVTFLADVVRRAETQLVPLEKAAAHAAHAAAVESRATVAAKVPEVVGTLAAVLAPTLAIVQELASAQRATAGAADELRERGEAVPADRGEAAALARFAERLNLTGGTVEQLHAIADLVRYVQAAPVRAAEAREWERRKELARAEQARLGQLGPEARDEQIEADRAHLASARPAAFVAARGTHAQVVMEIERASALGSRA